MGIMSEDDFAAIQRLKVAIVGVGGLGGNLANLLVRLGVKQLLLIDYDLFSESNLNRQLFSTSKTIHKSKVEVVKERLLEINPNCVIDVYQQRIQDISLEQVDYIIDTVDNPKTKIYISKLGNKLQIPVLHGSCAGWYGQLGWILPGCNLISEVYGKQEKGLEETLLNPSFTPSAVASMMCSEFLKMIQKSPETVINELLLIDLENNSLLKTRRIL